MNAALRIEERIVPLPRPSPHPTGTRCLRVGQPLTITHLQDSERTIRGRVRTLHKRENLETDIRLSRKLHQPVQPASHSFSAPHRTPEHALVKDRSDQSRPLSRIPHGGPRPRPRCRARARARAVPGERPRLPVGTFRVRPGPGDVHRAPLGPVITLTGYHLRPSGTILRLRAEFPDFLICELSGPLGKPCFTATSARTNSDGKPELVVTACPEELRRALAILTTEEIHPGRDGDRG